MRDLRYSLRTYRPGDEAALAAAVNAANAGRPGFAPTSAARWAWLHLRRPGSRPDGILLLDGPGGGLAAHAVVRPPAEVTELCVAAGPDRRTALGALVTAIEDYARAREAARISIAPPTSDPELHRWFAELGYNQWFRYLTGLPLDLPGILRLSLERAGTSAGPRFLICLSRRGRRFRSPRIGEETFLLIHGKNVQSLDGPAPADVIIRADLLTFAAVILRHRPVRRSLLRREVVATPLWRMPQARRLLSALAVPRDLHIPVGEMV